VTRQRELGDTSSHAFDSGFKDLEALLCNCLYTICGLHRRSGSWQDRACTASAILRRDMAILATAAENDLAHLRMLREVVRHAGNADDVLLHDPLAAAVHSTCQAEGPQSHFLARSLHC
jgi:hypothetical protein